MGEFTPGHWQVFPSESIAKEYPESRYGIQTYPSGYLVADCGNVGNTHARANARLIAAAPEMLEALKRARTCNLPTEVDDLVRSAIAKARGTDA